MDPDAKIEHHVGANGLTHSLVRDPRNETDWRCVRCGLGVHTVEVMVDEDPDEADPLCLAL